MRNEFNDDARKGPSNVLVPSVRDKDGTGYDIFSLLLKERTIVVQGQVESTMASNIIAQIKYLEAQDPEKEIKMLVNSPGGSVIDGMAILDVMRQVKCPITTIGNGMQASMGSILLAGGDKRLMMPNSQVLVHQIMGGAAGGTQHSDFENNAAHMAKLHESLKNVYVEFTGLNHKFWDKVGERDTWLTAEQAKKIGYIHGIVDAQKAAGPYADEAKRPEEEQNPFKKAAIDMIAKMDKEDVIKYLNNGNANEGEYARYRPELVTRLAEFSEFWVEKRKLEQGLQSKAKSASNDDKKATSRKARAPSMK